MLVVIRHRPTRVTFTLVELLVVIGIIAVLAGLLLAALAAARHAGRAVACASNMRQIRIAFHLYANESRQVLPFGMYARRGMSDPADVPSSYCVTWDDLLNVHLGGNFTAEELESATLPRKVPVLLCPSGGSLCNRTPLRARRSYSMNRVPYPVGVSPPGEGTDYLGVAGVRQFYGTITRLPYRLSLRLSEVRRSAETFLLVEFLGRGKRTRRTRRGDPGRPVVLRPHRH